MQPLQNCIGPTIRIGQEILCLPYAGFLSKKYPKEAFLSPFLILMYTDRKLVNRDNEKH